METTSDLVTLATEKGRLEQRLHEAERQAMELRAELEHVHARILEHLGMSPSRSAEGARAVTGSQSTTEARASTALAVDVPRATAVETSVTPPSSTDVDRLAERCEEQPGAPNQVDGGPLPFPASPSSPTVSEDPAPKFLTRTSKKTFRRGQLLCKALDDLGGAARRGELLDQVRTYDPTITTNMLVYSLRHSKSFTRDGDNRWMYVSSGVELSDQQKRRWARTDMLRRAISEEGGKARWKTLLRRAQQEEGDTFSTNTLNYTLRNGPFHKIPSGEYVWVGGDVRTEIMHDGVWWPLVSEQRVVGTGVRSVTLQRRDGTHFAVELPDPVPENRIRFLPADTELE